MEYREIVAVTGLSGLYQLVTTKSDGAVVRNIADKTTKFISARQHNVTPLESIEVYTTGENVRLQQVFELMQEHEATIAPIDAKAASNAAIKGYFKSIFPEFDEDRVYVSDMKKMLKWFELLRANDLLHFTKPEDAPSVEGQPAEATGEAAQPAAAETAPAAEADASPASEAQPEAETAPETEE